MVHFTQKLLYKIGLEAHKACDRMNDRLYEAEAGRYLRGLTALNEELRNQYLGRRCFILATGPSISSQDLSILAGEICLSVSNFIVHPLYERLDPEFHFIAPYHRPITEEAFQAWIKDIGARRAGRTTFFSAADYPRVLRSQAFSTSDARYLDLSAKWPAELRELELTKRLPTIKTVVIAALFAAIYMGFADIYLVGSDHTQILTPLESKHFYDEKESALVRHAYNEWEAYTDFGTMCGHYVVIWNQHRAIRAYARTRRVNIVNLSPTSLLDIYPKRDIADVIDGRLCSSRDDLRS